MTDEEARKIVKQALQVDDDYGDMQVEIILTKAGYRAGLEAAKKNYDDLSAEEWVYKSAWELHGEWLTQRVKKGQP